MKTKKARMLVAMAADGRYFAEGWGEGLDDAVTDSVLDQACSNLDLPPERLRLSWVTAEVPLPEPPAEVAGEVEG